jgi:hypothetical protein
MGFFSSLKSALKKAVKKVTRAVKSVVRLASRLVVTLVGLGIGIFDLLLGFLAWPPKKLRVHIFILSTEKGPLVDPAFLTASVDFARKTFKKRFNVKLLAYSKNMIEIIKEPAPPEALSVGCGGDAVDQEFAEAGEYFASHLAGWNGIPISLTFPVTVFIVSDVSGNGGCSIGPLTDYVTVDTSSDGVGTPSEIAHEVGHACNLWHSGTKSNLMYHPSDRGDGVKWFQKNLFRSSRHVTYW